MEKWKAALLVAASVAKTANLMVDSRADLLVAASVGMLEFVRVDNSADHSEFHSVDRMVDLMAG